jgi:hypothetical protein
LISRTRVVLLYQPLQFHMVIDSAVCFVVFDNKKFAVITSM